MKKPILELNVDLQLLIALLTDKIVSGNAMNVEVNGVVYDPLRVSNGFLYVAINIYTQMDGVELVDGHPFIFDAIANGACAIVLQDDIELPDNIVKILVPDSRKALSVIANKLYDYPSKDLNLMGVTGTNGKTTTTHIIESIFDQHYAMGLIGTIYSKIAGKVIKSKDTTPEPPDLQAIFQQMVDNNCAYCTLEASSHGIAFHRLNSLDFEVAIFTNLSPDHLEYHKTMENYLNTKLRLFKNLSNDKFAIINTDDNYGKIFTETTSAQILTTGIDQSADIMAKNIDYRFDGMSFDLITPIGKISVNSKLVGKFNIYNTLSAVGAAITQNIALDDIKKGIERAIYIAGRFEMVNCGQNFGVVIDYAHTIDGFESVLQLAKTLNPKRIITVFGCGGERSPDKRPLMGVAAKKYSDVVVITSDNPRNEDPEKIIADITVDIIAEIGTTNPNESIEIIVERQKAIHHAVRLCKEGDLLLILGKGHETTQIIKNRTLPFSDRKEAEKALAEILNKD